MKIGIDISQTAYEGTGVGNYIQNLVEDLLKIDSKNEYILFYSSLRKQIQKSKFGINDKNQSLRQAQYKNYKTKFRIRTFKIPQTLLDLLWNKLHILPIEWLIGDVDVFISSDWTQPPTRKAKKVTILYDLIVYKYPMETAEKIVKVHKRRLKWVKEECEAILCISEATKKDAMEVLGIAEKKLKVIYPGV